MEEKELKDLPGFRFHPTEEELVGFYLRHKVEKKPFNVSVIKELDIYAFQPWELPGLCVIEGEGQWFFFVKPRGHNDGRANRMTSEGFWKATGSDRPVYDHSTSTAIGLRKTLVFYKGRALKCDKTDWIMNEYKLHPSVSENGGSIRLCRVYKKGTCAKSCESQGTSHVEKELRTISSSSVMGNEILQANSAHYFARCKEDIVPTKMEMGVSEEDLKWLCWDGMSPIF